MKVLVVLGHQSKGSFCHAIADTAMDALSAAGHDLTFHDLYDEQFDPILPHPEIPKQAELPALIRQHCDEVAAADGYVVVHPNWWGQPPAMLKGWIDRVFRQSGCSIFSRDLAAELCACDSVGVFDWQNSSDFTAVCQCWLAKRQQ